MTKKTEKKGTEKKKVSYAALDSHLHVTQVMINHVAED